MQRGKISMFFLEAHFVKHSGDIVCLYGGNCLILVDQIYTGLCSCRVTLSENFDLGLGPAWDFTLGFFCINSMHQHHSPRSPPISPSSSIRVMIIIMIVIRKGSEIWFWESLPHCRLLPGKALERENCQLLIIVIVKVNTVSYKVSTYSKLTWCFRI